MALPQSEMALLQPSTSIGSSKKSNRQIQREVLQQKQLRTSSGLEKHVKTLDPIQEADGDDASLSGTSWRKKRRRRRKLKVEKMMLDPKPPVGEASDGESSDEEESDQNSEGMHTWRIQCTCMYVMYVVKLVVSVCVCVCVCCCNSGSLIPNNVHTVLLIL